MAWNPNTSEQPQKESTRSDFATYDCQTPWTAARCQRLLRPLSSKIALLRKEKQSNPRVGDHGTAQNCSTNAAPKFQGGGSDQWSRRRTTSVADEEWAPHSRPRKKLKRTYSSKNLTIQHSAGSSETHQDRPTQNPVEITIPSNLFSSDTETATACEASDCSQRSGLETRDDLCDRPPNTWKDKEPSRLPWASAPRGHYTIKRPFQRRLADGIHRGLDALLTATRDPKSSRVSIRGSRSLFATCLRKVPDVIAREESWNHMEDPEINVDVSSMIYSHLESFSTSTSGGWTPLRQLVRAHGVSMVGHAIFEGVIGLDSARRIFIEICLSREYDEAQHILQCLMQTMLPLQNPLKPSNETGLILQCLNAFVLATGRHSFHYRQLIWLLESGRLPLESIGRPDMIGIWNKVVQSITQYDEHAGPATELLRLVTSMTYGCCNQYPGILIHGLRLDRQGLTEKANAYMVDLGCQTRWPRGLQLALQDGEHTTRIEKASSTVSSLMTVLCAIGLLRSAGQASSSNSLHVPDVFALRDIAIDAQQILELAPDRILSMPGHRVTLPLLAAGLVQATLCRNQETFAATVPVFFDQLSSLDSDGSIIEEGGSFLCAVADCCARATRVEVFEHTQKIVQHVRHIAKSLNPICNGGELCNRMGLAAALEFAESTKHPKHLHWALDVEQALLGSHLESTRQTPVKTPLRGQARPQNGYRWEAGICEWVAKTPAVAFTGAILQGEQAYPLQSADASPSQAVQQRSEKTIQSSPSSCNRANVSKGSTANSEPSPKQALFSHIHIPNDRDGLSDCGSSQTTSSKPPPQLQNITNVATKCKQGPKTKDGHISKRSCWPSEPSACTADPLEVHDLALDSEDELSFL